MRNLVLSGVLVMAAAGPIEAQMLNWTDQGFVNLNVLSQPSSRDVTMSGSFDLYDERAAFEGRRDISGGGVFDIAAGARVWRNLAVSLGYSRFSDSTSVSVLARIPDPIVFDRPNEQVLEAGEFDHSESAVHISAVWLWPVTDRIDVALSAGPSFFSVKDQGIISVDVQPGTSIATGVARTDADESAVGANFGLDITYLIRPQLGAGLLLRYAGASVDLPQIGSLDVGGFQIGVGARVRF